MPSTDFDRFARTLGFEVAESGNGFAKVSGRAREEFLNGVGIAHGGFLFSLADYASAIASNTDSVVAVTSNSSINYLSPCPSGEIVVATARISYMNAKTGVCDVQVASQDSSVLYAVYQSRVIVRK